MRKARPRTTPLRPSFRMIRSTVQRATRIPSRSFSCRQTFRGPYAWKLASQTRRISTTSVASRSSHDARSRSLGQSAAARRSTRPHMRRGARRRIAPSLRSAVEFRLGEIRGRLAQDLVGALQLTILALEILEPHTLVGGEARSNASVSLMLAHPAAQRLRRAAELLGYRPDRRPLRSVLGLVLQDHPHGTLSHLR